jgi:hypothetical protein
LLCGSFLALLDLDTFIISELQTLKDPVSDSTGRILHWSDSLKSGLDFPLLGSGLGAYRYASLPYQKHFTGKWFQRADNQYVEVLVEGGLAGFACFVLTGLIALKYVRCGLSERSRLSPHSDEIVTGLSSAVLCAVVSIAGAAFFDYGISLPSVAAALVTLVVLLERQVKLKQSRSSRGDFAPSLNPGSPSLLSSVSALAVWVALIASSVMMIPDTLAAARLYTVSASVERQIQSSNVESLMEIGDQSLHDLDRALAERPDDVVARRTRCLFLELLVRREILKAQIDGKSRTPGQLGNEFRSIQISNLADGMLDAKMSDEVRSTIRIQLDAIFQSYPWPESLRELLDQAPCVLTIASKLSQCELLFGDVRSATSAMSHSRFTEPHGADSLYILGHLMLRAGRVEECRQCWSQSIAASESYRSTIMIELADQHGLDMALEWFLPETYEAAVKSAAAMPKLLPLRIQILRHADQLWDDQRPRLTETAILTRAQHLSMTAGEADAVLWLDGALQQAPQNLMIRKAKARLLEEAGQNSEAYDEWLRIQSFDLADPEPGVALERLIRLPPTTERD